jgi:hypothetical protein
MTFTLISEKSQEQLRFYYGWGSLAFLAGLALLVLAASANISLAVSVFFLGFGISLILIGISKPILPLILITGYGLILLGFVIMGIFVILFNAFAIIGLAIIAAVGGLFLFISRKEMVYD